jgi:programmed cell death protein 5
MQKQQADMKNSILSQILDQSARARLNTLKISKPEKAEIVEANLIRMAQMGQIGGKLTDEALKKLLESFSEQMAKQSSSTVKFDRRRAAIDSDSDEDYGI